MSQVLAIETSTRQGSVALLIEDEVRQEDLGAERAHARDLMPSIDRLLTGSGLSPGDLDALVVGLGPGSYTGLRVAAATALGLARGANIALVGVPSFESLAFDALEPGEQGAILRDARSGAVYIARYLREIHAITVLEEPTALPAAQVQSALHERDVLLADDDALRAAGLPEDRPIRPGQPAASSLARLGARRLEHDGPTAPADLEPLYLRPFAVGERAR